MIKIQIKKEKDSLAVFLFFLTVFIFFQSFSVYGGDSGDLLAAAATGSFAHPPGYPLYSLLARILTFLPLLTLAWRVGLLSSLFSALSLTLLYKLLKKYFAWFIALSVVFFSAFLYPVFLYSEVAEVFSMTSFFVLWLLYLALQWRDKKNKKTQYLFFIILGLSMTHHHIVFFSFPVLYYLLADYLRKIKRQEIKKYLLALLIGLTPYIYIPISSCLNQSLYYWGNGASPKGFIWLILRIGYGTFTALGSIGDKPIQRLISLYAFFRYLYLEYQFVAALLALLGLGYYLYLVKAKNGQKWFKKKDFIAFFILFLSYLFFIFYASFPLTSEFMMATVERFYILPFLLLSPFLALGIQALYLFLKNLENKQIRQLALMIFSALLLVLPAGSIGRNLPKIIILKNDFTAEELGRDILSSLPENSILIPGGDTVVFDSQYVHYGLGLRSDVLLLEWFFLGDKKYQARVLKKYQALNLELKDSNDDSLTAFIKKNMDKYPIYSNTEKSLEGLKHVPEGLSLRFYRPEATPSAQEVFDKNQAIAAGFQDYKNSSLNKYANLFLLNTKSVYSQAYLRLFLYFLDIGEYDKAEFFADKYTAFNGVSNVSGQLNFYLGEMYLGKNDCAKAEEYFQKAKQEFPDSPLPDAFLRKTYAECFNDPASAGEYLDSCLDLEKEAQPKLDEL